MLNFREEWARAAGEAGLAEASARTDGRCPGSDPRLAAGGLERGQPPPHPLSAPVGASTGWPSRGGRRCFSVGGAWERSGAPPGLKAPASLKPAEKISKFTRSYSVYKQPSEADECDRRAPPIYCELFAAALGHLEWLRFCLKWDRREIATDNKGFTAIHFAAQSGRLECLKVLVEEYKFPVDLPANNGQTPLHLVIHKDNKTTVLPCIGYLLKQGAALNSETCSGSTPLHVAAREGLLSCVKVLVKKGADVHARDAMGCKPIDYCKIWNHRICARFLKDAMWKRDKKDFACEMGKLKRLKGQLARMEQDYLTEYQKEHQIQREANFKKWLHGKLLPRDQSQILATEHDPRAPPWAIPLAKTPKPPKSFHPSPEERLEETSQSKLQSSVTTTLICEQPTALRPKVWNLRNNPARCPTTQIRYPRGICLDLHPAPSPEHDFRRFLKVGPDGRGGARLRTVAGDQVAPVPRLPLEVIVRELYPQVRPCRMKVPQGFRSVSIREVERKRYFGATTFRTHSLAMSLRETFDEAFLAVLRAPQGHPLLPSLQCPP